MKQLQHELDMLLSQTDADERIIEALKNEKAVFPFSIEGRILAYLISMRTISYDKYIELQMHIQSETSIWIYLIWLRVHLEKLGEKNIF